MLSPIDTPFLFIGVLYAIGNTDTRSVMKIKDIYLKDITPELAINTEVSCRATAISQFKYRASFYTHTLSKETIYMTMM